MKRNQRCHRLRGILDGRSKLDAHIGEDGVDSRHQHGRGAAVEGQFIKGKKVSIYLGIISMFLAPALLAALAARCTGR